MITGNECDSIEQQAGTTITFTTGLFRGYIKESDFFWRHENAVYPSFVVETSWAESHTRLLEDMNHLFLASNGDIKVIMLVKFRKLTGNRAKGHVEFYRRDRNGIPDLQQTEIIFPAPNPPVTQIFNLKAHEFLGGYCTTARANNNIPIDIDLLRNRARRALARMGLTPV